MPAPLPPQATPGNVVGEKYVLDAVIGRGGMGVVLSARHITLGKRVAVKLLLAEADENARARFELEAQAAAVLASPHIAQVLDFGVTRDGLAYLVMEYLEGRDLQVEKKLRMRLPIMEAVDIVLEASIGVAQAHAAGLVHRDIKPANVFLAQIAGRRVVKILDFGLIKVMSDGASGLTGTTETFGTPKYMAPEQLRSARSVDARADQHALAAILFEMITGRPPFDGESVPDIIIKIGTEPAPLASSVGVAVPAALEAALQRAMAKRPENRFPSLSEFAAAIAPFGTARASELALEIDRCLAATIGRRPLVQDELRSTVQMPRASSAPASSASIASAPSLVELGPSAPYSLQPHASAAHVTTMTVVQPAPAAASGSSTLSSSSVETFRDARPPAASGYGKVLAIAAVAAVLSVGALVFALQRSTGAADPKSAATGAALDAPSTTPSATAEPAEAPAATTASTASAPAPSGVATASTTTSASAAPSVSAPKPVLTATSRRTASPPVSPPRSHKPCASLDCLGQ